MSLRIQSSKFGRPTKFPVLYDLESDICVGSIASLVYNITPKDLNLRFSYF